MQTPVGADLPDAPHTPAEVAGEDAGCLMLLLVPFGVATVRDGNDCDNPTVQE
jgi:hypothetical protein